MTSTASEPSSITFSSFSEYASCVLSIHHRRATVHVAWFLKTPISVTVPAASSMAFRFVDPTPFMPQWSQKVMVPGRPVMQSVVTGRLQKINNDIAIAFIHPLPQDQMNFDDIRGTLAEFLNVQMNMPYQSIQPCPFGQACHLQSCIS